MSIRARVQEWLESGYTPAPNPLCSKRSVIHNLTQILQLIEDGSPYIAGERIKFLINDIENGKLDGGKL